MSTDILEILLLNKKINDISKLIENQDFKDFNINEIINMTETNILLFINNLVYYIQNNKYYKYKFLHYEKTVKLIIDIIIKSNNINKNIDLKFNDFIILKVISNVNNSHIYLTKIKKIIKNNNYHNINLLLHITEMSTFPVFLFWWNTFYKNIFISIEDNVNILSSAMINTDDRVYQFILNNLNNVNDIFTDENKKKILKK